MKETTQKRKRVSKAARQKQRLMIMGGGAVLVLVLIILLGVFVFSSCGTDYEKAKTNTVYVLEDGKIVSTDVEAFDEKTYDKGELKDYVKDVIDTYNKKADKKALKQKSFKVKDDVATLVLEYADTKAYEEVNGVELFVGTIKEAEKAGYKFEGTYAEMVDGEAITATADDFVKGEGYKVVIIKSNTKVVVPGEVCFVSTQNISKVGEDYVVIKDGCELLTTELDTEFGTEAEGSDGSISEDELESGDGDIIFDFGDEEEEKKDSQYSEVITYIIYK